MSRATGVDAKPAKNVESRLSRFAAPPNFAAQQILVKPQRFLSRQFQLLAKGEPAAGNQ